jgi:hypothetical protein
MDVCLLTLSNHQSIYLSINRSHRSGIYYYLFNQCLSPLTLWVWTPFRTGVLDITLCDKVCQWLAAGRWFFSGYSGFLTNTTDRHDITEILLKVALKTINKPIIYNHYSIFYYVLISSPNDFIPTMYHTDNVSYRQCITPTMYHTVHCIFNYYLNLQSLSFISVKESVTDL